MRITVPLGTPCPRCHHTHTRCAGHNKKTGAPCNRPPATGQQVCKNHGGGSPQARAAAHTRIIEAAAEDLIATVWNPHAAPVTDALTAIQQLAGSMAQSVDTLGARLNPTPDDGEPCEHCGHGTPADLDSTTTAAWLRVLRELRQLLTDMQRLGIAEKLVEVEQGRVRLVAVALGRALDELDLDEDRRAGVMRVLLAELRAGEDHDDVANGDR